MVLNVFLHYYKDLWSQYKQNQVEKRIIKETIKDALSLNRLIHEETRSSATDDAKHGFLNELKKVVQGTRTFAEAIRNHVMYQEKYS